ncbi:MAG: hypothetical protein GEV05_23300 [Betaproteobacteria bacterium]|nr:hypothetical protein [Betaproteobacteria bacterium]
MTLWRLVLILGGASLLAACGPHVYMLVPSDAHAGQLHHDIYGPEKLSVTYAGKTYSGDFETTRSHHIHGRHRRHLGWIADAQLIERSLFHVTLVPHPQPLSRGERGASRPYWTVVQYGTINSTNDGANLDCHLEWPYAGKPAGTCEEPTGKSFAVRFE